MDNCLINCLLIRNVHVTLKLCCQQLFHINYIMEMQVFTIMAFLS